MEAGWGGGYSSRYDEEHARARRRFADAEILYRLSQLNRQHPGIVRRDMVDRWTQRGYEGPYTADPAFVGVNPAVARPAEQVCMVCGVWEGLLGMD